MEIRMPAGLAEELIQFRRALHQHPEIGFEEYETTARIRDFLAGHGIEILDVSLATGLFAVVRGNRPGPTVAVRSDIDALPIEEETGLEFASQIPGKMHACGHDFHTACALGAAVLAKQAAASADSFSGTLLFVFQPAEELGAGAKVLLETGIFETWNVCAIIGEHNNPLVPAGTVGVREGPLMGSVDEFSMVITGKGGHAAQPDRAVDPVLIAAHLVAGVQHVVSRTVSPLESAVVTVGKFHAGTARNVIPEQAVLEGTIRALSPHVRDRVEERFLKYVQDTVAAFGGEVVIEYDRQLPPVVNDPWVTRKVAEAARSVVGTDYVIEGSPTLAGEDFAVYQERIPGCFFWVGTGRPDGESQGWHHPRFDVDEAMVAVTSRILLDAAIRCAEHIGEANSSKPGEDGETWGSET